MPNVNIEAEQYVLGSILLEGDLIKELNMLPEHFYRPANKTIFEAMKKVDADGDPVDLLTVVTYIKSIGETKLAEVGGVDYLTQLAGAIPTTENIKTYEKYVLDAWKLRQAEIVANKIKEESPAAIDTDIISRSIQELSRLDEIGHEDDYDLKKRMMEIYEKMENQGYNSFGVPSGFFKVDTMTNGFQNQDLIIIGARPSVGKTAFALNIGANAALKDVVVSIFSLEMADEPLIKRLWSFLGLIESTKLRNPGKFFEGDDWQKLTYAMSCLVKTSINIYDKSTVTIQEIRSKLRKQKKLHPNKKHLCIIDYLQLIRGRGRENRTIEVAEISRELKLTARDLDMPIIALSQLSRSLEQRQDKRPMLSDLRESGSVEQDADLVAFLYRDDYYNADTEDKNVIEVLIAKQRNGPTGKVKLSFQKEFNRFSDL